MLDIKISLKTIILNLIVIILLSGCGNFSQQLTPTFDPTSAGWMIITPRPVNTHTPTVSTQTGTTSNLTGTSTAPAIPTEVTSMTPQSNTETPETATPTSVDKTCKFEPGQVRLDGFESAVLNERMNFRIYLPPCYDDRTEDQYPVLYLLHGLYKTYDQWVDMEVDAVADNLIADGEIVPMIIVMPGETAFINIGDSEFDEAVMQELIPYVDAHYRSRTERSWRAIGGLSRGAAWALSIGVDNWRSFSAIGMHSLPLIRSERERLLTALVDIPLGLTPRLFMDIGNRDPELVYAQLFEEALTEEKIPHTWYMFIGLHEESYWQAHLAIYLRWYAEEWVGISR